MKNFLLMYLYLDFKHRKSLMFYILKSYVDKENRNKNPEYGTNLLNFLLAIYASDNRALGFASKYICSISCESSECCQ